MSGGSLNYLYSKDETAQILNAYNDIYRVKREIGDLGYPDIEKDISDFLWLICETEAKIENRFEKLSKLFHDTEWYIDSDIGIEDLRKTCEEYLKKKKSEVQSK